MSAAGSTTLRSAQVRLSRAATVALTPKGVRLPAYGEHRSAALSASDLAFLRRLSGADGADVEALVAEVAATTDSSAEQLHELIERLHDRGFLSGAPSDAASGGSPPPRREVTGWVDDGALVARTPTLMRPVPEGFDVIAHDGSVVIRLDEDDLVVLSAFSRPKDFSAVGDDDEVDLDPATLRRIVGELIGAHLLVVFDYENSPQGRSEREMKSVAKSVQGFIAAMRAELDERDRAEAAASRPTARTRVLPVLAQPGLAPLALGMLFAHAKAFDDGRLVELFDFTPNWNVHKGDIDEYAGAPAIYLFSDYVWSSRANATTTTLTKEANPANVNVHGGPDAPRSAPDVEAFFAANPAVDVVVHGEGEATAVEMLDVLGRSRAADGSFDLAVLRDVAGLTFRLGDEIIRTADRDRIVDLDVLPSPYLDGTFAAFGDGHCSTAIIETNRGCPYGCTFCDWGSATLSRIRKFDLERVFAELEWCAKNRVLRVFVADANFGIMERDVLIAEKLASLKKEYGYPRAFGTNYAKNTVKHLKQIVQSMVEADVLTEGLLSLQTMDEGTLKTIKRSNIKTEKYDLLASEFRAAGLPLFVDIMLGLPGSTTTSFRADLQQCIDREVTAKIFQTEVLVNSPMNEPAYRAEHQIQTANASDRMYDTRIDEKSNSARALVVSTASFTREDYDEMLDLRRAFRLFENFGVLRWVTRYVRQEAGVPEAEVIDRIRRASKDAERWPFLALTLAVVPGVMVPPLSWSLFLDETRRFAVEVLGVPDDSALDTVIQVQSLLLPAPDRTFPMTVELEHDYAAWFLAMVEAKESGHIGDWEQVVPRLRDLPPASFTVDDPAAVCTTGLGFRNEDDFYGSWELGSPVGRSMPARHQIFE